MKLSEVKPGDKVFRMVAGEVMMELHVTEISDDLIKCGPWEFSRRNGAEIDPDCGWDERCTGSYLQCEDGPKVIIEGQ